MVRGGGGGGAICASLDSVEGLLRHSFMVGINVYNGNVRDYIIYMRNCQFFSASHNLQQNAQVTSWEDQKRVYSERYNELILWYKFDLICLSLIIDYYI